MAVAKQLALKQQLCEREALLEDTVEKISAINLKIFKLTQKFTTEIGKIQLRLSKVQASRPRGNPANQWPHRPMTNRLSIFYQTKERKERGLWQRKNLLQQAFDHDRAILTSQRLVLTNLEHDIESQIRIIKIQLH